MMNGRSFKETAANLADDGRRLFREHGSQRNGREAFVEQIIEDAMVRLAFGEAAELDER